MGSPLLKILIRVPLCVLATWLAWRALGTIAFAFCAPIFGVALARPLIDLFSEGHGRTREWALRDVQGRFYEHHGNRIDIAEDDEDDRWLLAADVRKIIAGLPRDEVLQKQYPERAAAIGEKPVFRIRADALLEYLRKATDPASVRFKVWLEREVVFPSRKR
ncbi:hypothetical protein [Ramlibacter albus]|uniref:Bro-N domain-containing protein n=1 Tax=Ramlibacter albus TaxID=2079448 RepID=A0A923M669_9BURK|nr:hypothetical protein [Ramlibacter albus]MBC5764967.1 hypothetical protein [Ramlibacter albus]